MFYMPKFRFISSKTEAADPSARYYAAKHFGFWPRTFRREEDRLVVFPRGHHLHVVLRRLHNGKWRVRSAYSGSRPRTYTHFRAAVRQFRAYVRNVETTGLD